MFDIGFSELVIIGVVGLLVIGPERLPGAIRTASLWLSRIRRGFNDIKREVEQEIHNDAVMRELRETGERLQEQTSALGDNINKAVGNVENQILAETTGTDTTEPTQPADENEDVFTALEQQQADVVDDSQAAETTADPAAEAEQAPDKGAV